MQTARPVTGTERRTDWNAVNWRRANRHVRNTIFSELATHTRFRLLEAHGFPQERFESLRFGPVMFLLMATTDGSFITMPWPLT